MSGKKFSVSGGSHSGSLAEAPYEIFQVMEAGTFGYLNDFQICLCEQVFGVLDADICQVFNKAASGLLLKDI